MAQLLQIVFVVRKLIGKPAFLTIADCESEARRIHCLGYEASLSVCAAASKAFRNQSGLDCPEARIAALIPFASGGQPAPQTVLPWQLACQA